ncbi:oligosaccharide flippase family protein [Candidatus Chazhemtobacterium aquaticus]|uniref:O-antigen flippase n=1 Tax=Candidatus Chazhemtobacterium aquaticus TaxID=2715735 RepID=A0A857NDQ7_9BACT|nr:oligosaccharide flippase family protein [Candidatus Chazhemtobacterium aquaticus]QHO63561.1 O-antigen flippase [Candidatus Chazhemtobacterium aquaticus]
MSIKKTLIKNSSYNLISYAYLAVASLISIPIILNSLGGELYGSYILFNGIVLVAATFDLGLSQATIRWLSLPKINQATRVNTWKTSLFFFYILAALLSFITFILLRFFLIDLPAFTPINPDQYLLATVIASGIVLINHLNIAFLTIPQAHQRFDIYNTRTIIVGTANTLITAWLSTKTDNIAVLLGLQFIFHLSAFITLLSYSHHQLGANPLIPKLHKQLSKELLGFGGKNFVTNIANQIRVQFSNFILGGLIGPVAVTAFSIPQNLIIKAAGAISQVTLAFFPLSTSLTSPERFPKLKRLIIQLQLIIFLLGIIQVFVVYQYGYQILTLWLNNPEVVIQAYPVLKILSWFFLLTILTPIPTAVFESLNKPQIPAITASLNTIFTIGLIYMLTSRYNQVDPSLMPAYANLISSLILVPALLIALAKSLSGYEKTIQSTKTQYNTKL